MLSIRYLPYQNAHTVPPEQLVAVDFYYPRGLNLAHLYNERVPDAFRSDTSTETVLKWLAAGGDDAIQYATCNHWDIDGFLALWSVLNPISALRHRELLVAAAELGDFRTFDDQSAIGLEALKLCCLLNEVERAEFCLPFGDYNEATMEYEVATHKFEYFLKRFEGWLADLESFRDLWEAEYRQVLDDLAFIDSGEVRIIEHDGISVMETPRPLHYYAAWTRTNGYGVVTILSGSSYYEFEYKYESLVGRSQKQIPARRDLLPLAEILTKSETDGVIWCFDSLNEGGPILRPEKSGEPISRELRYQNLEKRVTSGHPRTTLTHAVFVEKLLASFTV